MRLHVRPPAGDGACALMEPDKRPCGARVGLLHAAAGDGDGDGFLWVEVELLVGYLLPLLVA